ncbi:hypothetical protein BKP35_17135 [Anaerobacillus arseniciselenatis]|uniref:Uncharacterized protein n=1 Tax=Anaerobacillus arseniciselenatis TaxID=85682 RepID=A0A1S2LAH2_9BACI|nr:DUF58 domain-containing protein [Anaerobacillus arseniciselenatis]OIJ09260.1 hypothetical protein BKP35_17135 [Anaerobacillus arseniciselenatis]
MSWNQEYRAPQIYRFLGPTIPILFIVTLINQSALIFGLAMLLTLLIGLSSYYLKYAYKNTTIPDETEIVRMFPEDKSSITIPIENQGKFPIFNGELAFFLYDPDEAVKVADTEVNKQSLYRYSLSIQPFTKKQQNIDITALKRGVVQIRSIEYTVHDLLKISQLRLNYNGYFRGEMIVYPTPKAVKGLEHVLQHKQGQHPKQHAVHEDVMMTMGTREYVQNDPFNRINWKASARTNELQTKIYEKTTVLKWSIVVNVRNEDRSQMTIETLEDVLSQVAFICQYATKHHISFELFINIRVPRLVCVHLPSGLGKDQLMKALELLARVNKNAVTTQPHEMLKVVELKSGDQPFIIHLGEYSDEEENIYLAWKQNGTTVYRVESKGEVGQVIPIGGGKNEAMAN